MPQSKSRHHHHHPQHHPAPNPSKARKPGRAMMVATIFFALSGLGIGYFIAPDSVPSLVVGAIIGAIAGYLFGHQIEKTLGKK